MLIYINKFIILVMMILITGGCAAKAVTGKPGERQNEPEKSISIFSQTPSDSEIYAEALSLLINSDEPDYPEVKSRLVNFVEQFPESSWNKSARALILTLDNYLGAADALRKEKLAAQMEQEKYNREINALKNNVKRLNEKELTEFSRLQQENEQLKNDIQQLKNLEIQLEKREKMLR